MHGTAAAPKKLKNIRVHKAPKWDRDVDDYYVEEDWCSARLFEQEHFQGSILDPACGSGRIVNNARLAGYTLPWHNLRLLERLETKSK
jgi:hypothetical protein